MQSLRDLRRSANLLRVLREALHFLWWAPSSLYWKSKLSQPELYDLLMKRNEASGAAVYRRKLVAGLAGEVLEIGVGTGLQLPYYQASARVTAIEPDPHFLAYAHGRADESAAHVTLMPGSVDALPFENGQFSAVVCSLVLCSVSDVAAALREISRVLAPGGELRLIEHVRSEGAIAGPLMDAINPIWLRLNGQSCNLHRDTERLLGQGGFEVHESEPFQVFSPGLPAFPMRLMRATPRER